MSTPSKLSEDVERVIRQVDRDMNGYEAGILRSALSAQSARIKELEAALEPFANWWACYLANHATSMSMPVVCRRAAAALNGEG